MHKLRTAVGAAMVGGTMALGVSLPTLMAGAQTVTPQTAATDCPPIYQAVPGELTKAVARTDANGQATLTVTLTSNQGPGTAEVQDCSFVDTTGKGTPSGTTFFYNDFPNATFSPGTNGTGVFQYTITLGAKQSDRLCDRAERGTAGDVSQTVCNPPISNPIVPDSRYAVALPLSAAALMGIGFTIVKRRRRQPTAA